VTVAVPEPWQIILSVALDLPVARAGSENFLVPLPAMATSRSPGELIARAADDCAAAEPERLAQPVVKSADARHTAKMR